MISQIIVGTAAIIAAGLMIVCVLWVGSPKGPTP